MPAVSARTERLTACPLCGHRGRRVICRTAERLYRLSEQEFEYSQCSACRVVYQSIRPVEADVAAFYPPDYGPYQSAAPARLDPGSQPHGPHFQPSRFRRAIVAGAHRLNRRIARRWPDSLPQVLDRIYAPPYPGARLMDFGCGSDQFLNQARNRGWRTLGVDFVPSVVEAVRVSGHEAMLLTPDMWDAIPDASLDLVRMNHVLEHLYEPLETLSLLRRKLRPGGRLHLATPNAACWTFRVLRRRWFSLDCPRHIMLFSPRSARPLLRRAGFRRIQIHQEVLTKDMARSVGYWLQDRGRLDHVGVLELMHQPNWNAVLFAPARFAALAGCSDRFHAIAIA